MLEFPATDRLRGRLIPRGAARPRPTSARVPQRNRPAAPGGAATPQTHQRPHEVPWPRRRRPRSRPGDLDGPVGAGSPAGRVTRLARDVREGAGRENRGEIAITVARTPARVGDRLGRRLLGGRPRRPARQPPTEAFLLGPPVPAEASPEHREEVIRDREAGQAEAIHPGYGFLAENSWRSLTPAVRPGIVFVGPPARRDRGDGFEDPGPRADGQGRGADRARGDRGPRPDVDAARKMARRSATRSLPRKATERRGGKGFPASRRAGRPVSDRLARHGAGRRSSSRADCLPRALPGGPAPHRDPGAGRRARQRHPPGRARVLDPAPPSEADRRGARAPRRRGDAGADRADREGGRAGGRLQGRRDD